MSEEVTTDTDELVKRLRLGGPNAEVISDEVADRLEALQAEKVKLRDVLKLCESSMAGHPMWDSEFMGPCSTLQAVSMVLAGTQVSRLSLPSSADVLAERKRCATVVESVVRALDANYVDPEPAFNTAKAAYQLSSTIVGAALSVILEGGAVNSSRPSSAVTEAELAQWLHEEWRTSRPSGRLLCIKAASVTHWRPTPAAPHLSTPAPRVTEEEQICTTCGKPIPEGEAYDNRRGDPARKGPWHKICIPPRDQDVTPSDPGSSAALRAQGEEVVASCGCAFCDLNLEPTRCTDGLFHLLNNGGTKPEVSLPSTALSEGGE